MPVVPTLPEYPFPRHKAGVLATVLRRELGAEDAHGNPVESWVEYAILESCAFDPGSTSEPRLPGQERVIVEPALYAAHDAPVAPADRIRIDSTVFEVDGDPRRWSSPFSGTSYGCVITLRKVDG